MTAGGEIREHMRVLGADGGEVGRVDGLEHGRIKLTRVDDPVGHGAHRFIPLGAVAMVEGDVVRLTLPATQARAMAAGGSAPERLEEGFAGTGDAAALNQAGVGDSSAAAANGPGSGNIRGGGTTAGRQGLAGGSAHGGGTGGGGTTAGHLGSGPGFRGDPNMDPSGRGEV
ncbi:DUF2171 domain-containing protein [Falsiroseomonas sp. CW058]|uniref:DUF2171 domain-containing protein n=1 Tax=Falsiroseomonas sp. CW058 TaxID=3388664 RepID=UPI003D31822B